MEAEKWINIPNFNGRYKISNRGKIKTVRDGRERILKQSKTQNSITLYKNGTFTRINKKVLIAQLFGGGKYEKSRGKRLFKEYNPEDEMPPLYVIRRMLRELKR